MKHVSTESTSGSANAALSARRNSLAVASVGRFTGPCVTLRPQLVHASAVSVPSAVELATTATRSPGRQGLVDDELGDVEELVDVLHPDDARLLEHGLEHLGPRLRAPHPVPRGTPKRDTPDFTTMTGLMRARLRAIRENLRGLPIDSR